MAASPLDFRLPALRDDVEFFSRSSEWRSDRLDVEREKLQTTLSRQDRILEDFGKKTDNYVNFLKNLLQNSSVADIDDAIDLMIDGERSILADKRKVAKAGEARMRGLAQKAPEAIVLMNEALREFASRHNRMAAIIRDARWSLMTTRAALQGGAGVGPIHGSGEPPDGVEAA